jgi:methyl-accepting chemotaxis protein
MLKLFTNLPIFRRLFIAFLLAALIPNSILLVMGIISIQTLKTHGISSSLTDPLLVGIIIAMLASMVVVIMLGYIMNLTISRPLRDLVSLTGRIGRGETSARAKIVGRDEISIVATSINSMLDSIVRLLRETQGQHETLQARIEKFVKEVNGIGEGDLRIQAVVTHDTLGMLANSFNSMIEELSNLVVRVKNVAQKVEISTINIYEQMVQVVRSADVQIEQIATAAQEVGIMATSSYQVVERIQVLDSAAKEAHLSAHQGRNTVQDTMEGMSHIFDNVHTTAKKVEVLGVRSLEINDIVEVISSIAYQTNRLALDASVQAGMAGENGKGFAAVAADIRRLAERTKEQTSKVTSIVHSIHDEIGAVATSIMETEKETTVGARLIRETGNTLATIFALVERQAQDIQHINQQVQQLLFSSANVVKIIQGVSELTLKNSDSTRLLAQNMEYMFQQAKQLHESVQVFKLRSDRRLSQSSSSLF